MVGLLTRGKKKNSPARCDSRVLLPEARFSTVFFLSFQAGDTVGDLFPFGVRVHESSLMSVVYVFIFPESDRHAGIQYD